MGQVFINTSLDSYYSNYNQWLFQRKTEAKNGTLTLCSMTKEDIQKKTNDSNLARARED